jgi:hypothetical protein
MDDRGLDVLFRLYHLNFYRNRQALADLIEDCEPAILQARAENKEPLALEIMDKRNIMRAVLANYGRI